MYENVKSREKYKTEEVKILMLSWSEAGRKFISLSFFNITGDIGNEFYVNGIEGIYTNRMF